MEMHLAEIPVYTIMIIGRLSSDEFLPYIRKQVAQFSLNISKRMLETQNFVHVPNTREYPKSTNVDRVDPPTRNHPNNAQTRKNIGSGHSV